MLNRSSVFVPALAALIGATSAPAATPCDWDATRKRNDNEVLCYNALGPKSKDFSYAEVPQAKLENCLVRAERTHRWERLECAKAAKAPDATKR